MSNSIYTYTFIPYNLIFFSENYMTNPWLEIPFDDYENHMSNKEVGQLKILNQITRDYLEKHKPEIFVLLGCCTGNGLEHINNDHTKLVYAIDINPEYLAIANSRFKGRIPHLHLICIDLNSQNIPVYNADLVFGALILEYLKIEIAVKKIFDSLKVGGKAIILIQKNNQKDFVSKTNCHSLEKLRDISREVNEDELIILFEKAQFQYCGIQSFPLPSGKEFLVLEFEKKLS